MKIAFITPFPPYRGGISKHSENLYNSFINHADVKIFNFKRQYPNFLFPGKTQYRTDTDNSDKLNSQRTIDSINPISWSSTANKINEEKFDVLLIRYWHPFFIPCYNFICKRIKSSKNKTLIYAICDNILPHESYTFQKSFINSFLSKLDGAIVMSDNVENELVALNRKIKVDKVFLPILDDLPNKIDKNVARKLEDIDIDKVVLLFFGLIRDYKGLDILLEAISQIDKKLLSKLTLLIVGECYENKTKYDNIINSYKIKDNIMWINKYVPDSDVNKYFSLADYIVVPYKTSSQSGIIPMSYFYDKPMIGSNIPGISEHINNGKTGFLFNNSLELQEIITSIIKLNNTESFVPHIQKYKENLSTEKLVKRIFEIVK